MVAIKPIGDSSTKWSDRSSNAVMDLIKGVKNPRKSWSASAKSAEENYKISVKQAADQGRYGKGIDRSSDEAWASMTEAKAQDRYPQGVKLGEGAWQEGFQPYQEVISRTNIPKRTTRGSQQNFQRSAVIGQALNQARERILKAS